MFHTLQQLGLLHAGKWQELLRSALRACCYELVLALLLATCDLHVELVNSVVKVLRRQFLGTSARDSHTIGTCMGKK